MQFVFFMYDSFNKTEKLFVYDSIYSKCSLVGLSLECHYKGETVMKRSMSYQSESHCKTLSHSKYCISSFRLILIRTPDNKLMGKHR